MEKIRKFLARKDVVFTLQRYGIDALGAMAQGLFCTLLVGTILNTLGQQFGIGFLTRIIVTVGKGEGAVGYTIGGLASAMVGPGIAVAIGFALGLLLGIVFSRFPRCSSVILPILSIVLQFFFLESLFLFIGFRLCFSFCFLDNHTIFP